MTFDPAAIGVVVGNTVLVVLSSYTARRAHKSGRKLDKIANGELDRRIYQAVKEELATARGDEIRTLMDAIIRHSIEEDR